MRASQRGCFPFLCAGRSVNASAHYLRPSLSFFQSRLATLTPCTSSKFFFFFVSSLQLHPSLHSAGTHNDGPAGRVGKLRDEGETRLRVGVNDLIRPLLVLRVPALLSGADGGAAVNGPLIFSTPGLEKTAHGDAHGDAHPRARTRGSLGVSARLSPACLIFATDPLSRAPFSH